MKNKLFYVTVLVGIAIFLWFKKNRGGNYVGVKPAGSDVAREIKEERQNHSPGVGPNIAIGSKVKLEYKIRNAKTGVLIAETGKNDLPTNFQIGEPNVFGDLLNRLVGANEGTILKITLPPQVWVPEPSGQEFAKKHAVSNDVILLIEFKVVEIVAK